MFNNKKWLLILLSGHNLTIMPPEAELATTIPIPETLVSNLELKNRDGVELMVTDWCKQRTYANTEVLWLLADDLVFETVLPASDKDLWEQKATSFLEAVPFEHTLSRRYTTPNGTLRVLATNHELIMAFVQSFAKHGYAPVALIPFSLLHPPNNSLSIEIRNQALSQSSDLIAASLLTTTGNPMGGGEVSAAPTQSKSQLPLLLSVFAILLVILIIVIVLNY